MKITNTAGDSFELKIVGYEYPEITETSDSNWLLIEVRVQTGDSTLSAVRPCLMASEVEQLAAWLKNLRKNLLPNPVCSFTEPNLEFQIVENDAGKQSLRVFFQLGFPPSPDSSEPAGMEDLWMDFDLESLDPAALAHALRSELQIFPQRVL